jgi:hypothetical protein
MANKYRQKTENEETAFYGANFPLFKILLLCKIKFVIPMVSLPPPPPVLLAKLRLCCCIMYATYRSIMQQPQGLEKFSSVIKVVSNSVITS